MTRRIPEDGRACEGLKSSTGLDFLTLVPSDVQAVLEEVDDSGPTE